MEPLEYLARCNECYISDLRIRPPESMDFAPLLRQPAGVYTVDEWNGLLEYIFPAAPRFETQAEARGWLQDWMGKK